ncbi:UNKNOWN [Stylonychia lemnae]|uniref:Uncharacterized protein n=1 Tax=Stylonychia lemnae TaxID=5949 RepID=A0A078AFC8_STYLE|nr:UNKNOWN [Stylonychia lemnae]|eukprot:CDW80232.1 UNKNOWN [Stylonychia lemnae]
MTKALILALFLGLSSAAYDQGWFYPNKDASFDNIFYNNYAGLAYKLQADVGYGTHYATSQPGSQKVETYGLHAYAFGQVHTMWHIANVYHSTFQFTFMPLYFEPYTQSIKWERPEKSGNDFHFYVKGEKFIRPLQFVTYVYENMETFERSVVDYVEDESDTYSLFPKEIVYDKDYEIKQEDPYWKYDLASKLKLGDFVTKFNKPYYDWKKLF